MREGNGDGRWGLWGGLAERYKNHIRFVSYGGRLVLAIGYNYEVRSAY